MTAMPLIRSDVDGLSMYPMMMFKSEHTGCENRACWHPLDAGVLTSELLAGNGPHDRSCLPLLTNGVLYDPCEHSP